MDITFSNTQGASTEDFGLDTQMHGGYEGSSRFGRELASWSPVIAPSDQVVNPNKELADARSKDMIRNDGYALGGVAIHRDSIVGAQFVLNAQPDWRTLGLSEDWAEEFQNETEPMFSLWAESMNCWPDAARRNTLTGLIRLAIGVYAYSGEVLATSEYIREAQRPYNTAIQMVDPDRCTNPQNVADTKFLRRGVELDRYGAELAFHFQMDHPQSMYVGANNYTWKRVPVAKPWGRTQVIHIVEQTFIDQTRGLSDMVSVLKEMKMTKKFQDITLQQAVLQATYAATIESELPPEAAFQALGQGGTTDWAAKFLQDIAAYTGSARNINIDGVKIPHLYPGTKLNLRSASAAEGVGEEFEQSLLRHIAAALGLSYEQFSRDYTKTNYSSARASMNETWKFMQARKKVVADRFATHIYSLWLEEALNKGHIKSVTAAMPNFYKGLNKEAYCRCTWIGASRGQIDEYKETQAAVLRIKEGLSTFEEESARLGKDFRELFAQRAREKRLMEKLDIVPVGSEPVKAKTAEKEEAAQERTENARQMSGALTMLATAITQQGSKEPTQINVHAAPAPDVNVEIAPAVVNVAGPPGRKFVAGKVHRDADGSMYVQDLSGSGEKVRVMRNEDNTFSYHLEH